MRRKYMNIKYRINGEPAEVCYYESSEECPEFPMVEIRSRFGIRQYVAHLAGTVYPAESEDWDEESEPAFPMELEGAFLLFAGAVLAGIIDYYKYCSEHLRWEIPDGTDTKTADVKFCAAVDEECQEIGYLSAELSDTDGKTMTRISAFPLYDLSFAPYDGITVIEGLGVCTSNEYLTEARSIERLLGKEEMDREKEIIEDMRSYASINGPISKYIKHYYIDQIVSAAVRVSFEELPDDAVIGSFE